ncbi:hypothetical protein [Halanaerobacter jeridensis]|uniref:Uncharacterized protein n=1 Tax=Halanaerobacter jeridensis TaxID=706427 RepID=A0A939BNP9_9FIRM|nr:hypothetical protein [Halanaerobacter jeridensis]MBM7555608.1 hypothetical protein [Halanaerobacter jeridensis]
MSLNKDDFISNINKICYIEKINPDDWLRVRLNDGRTVALPSYLKVKLEEIKDGREYFKILEGAYRGKKASVKQQKHFLGVVSGSYFTTSCLRRPPAVLTFDRGAEKLSIEGLGTYHAKTDEGNPISKGSYNIEIPDAPHTGGNYYLGDSRYAKTWFRIGHSLHPGERSAGCITVKDTKRWTEIYRYLIISRKRDSRSVGIVKVI